MEAVVRQDGSVEVQRIISSESSAFAEAAVAAIEQWRFSPGMRDGETVDVVMDVVVTFTRGIEAATAPRVDDSLPQSVGQPLQSLGHREKSASRDAAPFRTVAGEGLGQRFERLRRARVPFAV